jgi:hypothetical protein
MDNVPIDDETKSRLEAVLAEVGGIEPTSRRLDLPARTLRNALDGRKLRRGTRLLIQRQLAERG